jgi:Rieske Fe-S protein
MSEKRSIGLKSIKIGAIANDGGMGTALAALGETFRGTGILETEDGSVTEFFTEESADPVEVVEEKGKTTLKWTIINLEPTAMVKCLGGTVSGTNNEKWSAPSDVPVIEQSIEVVTPSGVKVEIPRTKIRARIVWNLARTEVAQVSITATVLTPNKTGVAPYTISKV